MVETIEFVQRKPLRFLIYEFELQLCERVTLRSLRLTLRLCG